jgi:predicted peroxiredoxin
MKLGIVITTDKHLDHILGITRSALAKGHEVNIFNMDEGVKLLENSSFTALCKEKGITMCFCDYSTKTVEISTEGVPGEIACGSQFDNANMNHDSDKVIIL